MNPLRRLPPRQLLAPAVRHLHARYPAVDPRARRDRRRVVVHWSRTAPPSVLVGPIEPTADDVAIARRLLDAHRAMCADAARRPEEADMWAQIAVEQAEFVTLLQRDDPRALAAYLCNVSRHRASHGISQGHLEYERLVRHPLHRDYVARMALDKLILLAEALGAIAPQNPEQGRGRTGVHQPSRLVELVEQRLGMSIAPPPIDGGMLKLDTGRGLFGERDLNAIYTAHLLRGYAAPGSSICEIGGGTGRVALWARRMGIASYTIVDLPLVNVVQGFYALKTMPGDEVVLYGEEPPRPGDGRLWILPPHGVDKLGDHRFDVFLNQDSMPEMSRSAAVGYLRWIGRTCDRAFVSINHETQSGYGDGLAHLSVGALIDEIGGLRRRERHPYWLRRGYVQEVYEPQATPEAAI